MKVKIKTYKLIKNKRRCCSQAHLTINTKGNSLDWKKMTPCNISNANKKQRELGKGNIFLQGSINVCFFFF